MAVTAADVPTKYDVVFAGVTGVSDFGCVYLDSVEPSLPFRTHRAIYDRTPTFIERQNISGSWGDDQQDFFMTQTQNDWSLGSGQRYFNDPADVTQKRGYWKSLSVDIATPGQIALGSTALLASTADTVIAGCPLGVPNTTKVMFATSSNLYQVASDGTITDLGVHGAGTPGRWGMCTDGVNVYIAGSTRIRMWNGAAFANFDTAGAQANAGAIAFLNNQIYGCDGSTLKSYSATGVPTTIFTWKDATGTVLAAAQTVRAPKIIPFGGNLLVFFPLLADRPELWQYDGSATKRVAELTPAATGYDLLEVSGIVYMSAVSTSKPMIFTWTGAELSKLWESPYKTTNVTSSYPTLGAFAGDLVFNDPAPSAGLLMRYSLATGATYALASGVVTPAATGPPLMVSCGATVAQLYESALGVHKMLFYPSASAATSVTLSTSLFTFDSSLTKLFRGVTIDWEGDTAPNVAFQVDSVDGSYTALASGVVSGAETAFPAATTGRGISIQVTIPSGTTKIKRIYVRAAPELTSFKRGVYILDCTGTTDKPRQLRDGTPAALTGYETVQNLLAAATTKTPFTVTDKINGTYTGLVDLQDQEGWDVYEVHPYPDDKKRPGSYIVRVTVREV